MTAAFIHPAQQAGPDIGRLVKDMLKRWPVILLMLIVGTCAGYAAKQLFTPTYSSTTVVLLDPKRPGSYGAEGQFANLYVDNTKIGSVVSIIQSPAMLARVVESEHLADDPGFLGPPPSLLRKWLALLSQDSSASLTSSKESREARALGRLSQAVKAVRDGFTYVVKIEVTWHDPVMAQRLASAVANAYLSDQLRTKTEASQQYGHWLSERLTDLRAELIASEEKVEELRRKYGILESAPGQNVTTDRQSLAELTTLLGRAEGELAARQAKWQQVEKIRQNKGDLGALPEISGSRIIEDLRRAQIEVVRKSSELNARYTAGYAERDTLERDRRALEGQLTAEITRIIGTIRNDYETAVANRAELQARISALTDRNNASSVSEGRVQLREAQRIAEANRAFYDAQLNRLQEVEQQATRQDIEARIIGPATVPDTPKFPKTIMFAGGGAAFGLLSGFGIAVMGMLLKNRFVDAAWVESTMALPVLGTIPYLRSRELVLGDRRLSIVQYLTLRPVSRLAESLRSLRSTLRHATPTALRVLQITSAIPGEGKSTLAASLAISAAATGTRTVLVDLDIRNSSITNLFDLQQSDGVSDVLQGRAMIGSALQTHGKSPLAIVGAGMLARHRPDIIDTPHLGAMIHELTNHFDLVILDSPPILAASDAALISNLADATLLVAAQGTTSRDLLQQAVKVLRAGRAPLVGVAINKAAPTKMKDYGRTPY